MKPSVKTISLASSRDIPFNKLILSQSNVRRIKVGISIEELAEDIARRGLLQGLNVRAVLDANGLETGMFEIPAGGRRYRALERLVSQKRLAKTAPVPCIIREGGIAEEDSLAENLQRAPLHPLDQFRAFLALREKGQSEEDIAAVFFVSVNLVKQRLRLASVSSRLLDIYADDGLSLDQLMAFTVSTDHERQEQVFDRLQQSHDKQPYTIRRMLTEGAVKGSDKRALFVGVEAYIEAGGQIMRDLFQVDDGGWLRDVPLLSTLVGDKLKSAADAIGAEGWKWVEVAPDFPYGHTYGLRQLRGEPQPLTEEEQTTRDALQAEYDQLTETYDGAEELPEAVDERMGELETALEAFDKRPSVFETEDMSRAGVFISIAHDGSLRVERGYVRPEDEQPVESDPVTDADDNDDDDETDSDNRPSGSVSTQAVEPEEDEGLGSISERLMTELTSHRTLALRHRLGDDPHLAFMAALHALTLKTFYRYAVETCLELDLKSVSFSAQAPGLNDCISAEIVRKRHEAWINALPNAPEDLWETLMIWDSDSRSALFAHCVALSVNAIYESWNRRPRALAHAGTLAQALDLDMAALGWKPTVDNFLGRVTKARILQAVSEGVSQRAADRIAHLKKGEMASEAETLLAEANWVPEPLRTRGRDRPDLTPDTAIEEEMRPTDSDGPDDDVTDTSSSTNGNAEDPDLAAE